MMGKKIFHVCYQSSHLDPRQRLSGTMAPYPDRKGNFLINDIPPLCWNIHLCAILSLNQDSTMSFWLCRNLSPPWGYLFYGVFTGRGTLCTVSLTSEETGLKTEVLCTSNKELQIGMLTYHADLLKVFLQCHKTQCGFKLPVICF